ncbi:MAG: tetratricopeptide repeat protein [Deltaproteobacteria bacterium]|nr:tetratricopeptide repeat protein [Deltaproteobacteria bacterium]
MLLSGAAPSSLRAQETIGDQGVDRESVDNDGAEGERAAAPDATDAPAPGVGGVPGDQDAEAPATESEDHEDGAARDEGDERARELYLEGDQLYAEGRYEEAVESFVASYELSGRPLLLFNLANSYERMGAYEEAADALRRYRETASPDEQNTLAHRIEALEARVEPPETPAAPAPEERGGVDPAVGWVLVASGGVLAAASIVLGSLALVARNDAEAFCRGSGADRLCTDEAEAALARDQAFSIAADVTAAVGLAALAVGIVLVILRRGEESSPGATEGPRFCRLYSSPWAAPSGGWNAPTARATKRVVGPSGCSPSVRTPVSARPWPPWRGATAPSRRTYWSSRCAIRTPFS